jgi:hypothetical protein
MTNHRAKNATRVSWRARGLSSFTPHSTILALATLMLFGLQCIDDDGGVREDEFACEEAAAHLDGCCPEVDTRSIDCDYWTGCGSTHPTLLSTKESHCLTDLDCDTLQESGICDELERAIQNQDSEPDPSLELGPCSE